MPTVIRALILTFKTTLLGGMIGFAIGFALCFMSSGASAPVHFYVTYGLFCGAVGLGGGLLSGIVLGSLRYATRHDRIADV